ncbi:MAG: acyltransferase family protein [Pseudomonadota bacterium]
MPIPENQRLHFIDHLRAFMFLLMAFDHSLHAYAYYWGRFWFFRDHDRSIGFDVLYLQNQSIIMPMLFFIFGMFVLPSLARRGAWGYVKERFIRLGIPYIIGIPLMIPLLSYPKYHDFVNSDVGYFEFWLGSDFQFWNSIFFTERLQGGGPFWVLYAMALYSAVLIIACKLLPWVFRSLVNFIKWTIENPVLGFVIWGSFSAVLLGVSDLIWGAPWWIGFWRIFHLQASRFLLVLAYFFLGAAVYQSGILTNQDLMQRFSNQWAKLSILTAVLGVAYVWYSLAYFYDGAYGDEFHTLLREKGWLATGLWELVVTEAPGVLVRTTLHGFFCLSQMLLLLAVFYKFVSKPTRLWTFLAANCYGFFLFHEAVVIWCQYGLNATELPIVFKFSLTAFVGIVFTFLFNDKILLRIPIVRRVLSPEYRV